MIFFIYISNFIIIIITIMIENIAGLLIGQNNHMEGLK